MREIRSLTAIRGVAAIWVILHHLTLMYRYPFLTPVSRVAFLGFTGVDVFFVLSGFILTTVHQDLAPAALPAFALRRVLRIYPLHLAVLGALALLAWCWPIASPASTDWRTLPAVALLIQPYLGLTTGLWNNASWSAGVELACYALFPAGLFLCRRLPVWALALLALAAVVAEWRVQILYVACWTGWPCVVRGLGGFGLGMALGLLSTRVAPPRRAAIIGEILAVAALGWACASFNVRLVPLAVACLIWMLSRQAGPVSWALSFPAPVFLGRISFSLYLLDHPLIGVFRRFWPVQAHPAMTTLFLMREALFFAVLVALASLTNRTIERPAQSLFRRTAAIQPGRSDATSASAVLMPSTAAERMPPA